MGAILLDLEPLLDEMVTQHELQWGDVMGLVYTHLSVHHPDAIETYLDGSHPVFDYGPEEKV